MPIAVKWFDSTMRGAPTISGTAGSMIAAIDACLITGFGAVTATGITVSGGIATATVPSGQSFAPHAVVLISGATPTALNGEARVLTSSSTQITFATTAADGAASGTIEIRYAPVGGWEKVFSATNKAAYRSLDAAGARHYLRVDDTGSTAARVRGYEAMSDVETGTGPFPTEAQVAGGGLWWKSAVASAAPAGWLLAADSRMILLATKPSTASGASLTASVLRGFGDPITFRKAGDAWCTLLSASGSGISQQNAGNLDGGGATSSFGSLAAPRAWHGLGASVLLQTNETAVSGSNPQYGTAPSEIDGEIKMRPVLVQEGASRPPRAQVPGVYHIPQSGLASVVPDRSLWPGAGGLAGRQLLACATGVYIDLAPSGAFFIDVTGPWRA